MDLRLLELAQKGNVEARNTFIEDNKSYIHRYASQVCKRYLLWENDDELSVALMAFNEAINSFKSGSFEAYSKMVIKSRLIDFFRKNSKIEVPIDNEDIQNQVAYDHFLDEKLDRAAQIILFKELMKDYKITLEDLTQKSPKHKDTREKLINLSREIAERSDLVTVITSKNILPIKEILEFTPLSRKILEEWRKYIISLVIIFSDKRLDSLKEFII